MKWVVYGRSMLIKLDLQRKQMRVRSGVLGNLMRDSLKVEGCSLMLLLITGSSLLQQYSGTVQRRVPSVQQLTQQEVTLLCFPSCCRRTFSSSSRAAPVPRHLLQTSPSSQTVVFPLGFVLQSPQWILY